MPIDVDSETGDQLRKDYKVGNTYPVFILASSDAKVIYRWTGYTGSATFISSLNKAKSETITVEDRKARFKVKPIINDAVFMAQYSADAGDYLDAVSYYRKADSLTSGAQDYSYEIFKNMANAIWTDQAKFSRILPAADAVLNAKRPNSASVIGTARIISRLAQKKGQTNKIAKYIQAGINAAEKSRNSKDAENLAILKADYKLYADLDTLGAVKLRKESLGSGWSTKPEKFYDFAKWCAERKIDLDEAEPYARKAAKLALDGEFKGQVLNTLAEICYAQGKTDEAISLMEQAMQQDPKQETYLERFLQYKKESGK